MATGSADAPPPGGEMDALMRGFDWSRTPVGDPASWPQSLRIVLRILLGSRYAMWLGWGPDLTFFYNDAYARMTLGPKHPWALGRSAREVWAEIWGDIGPRAEQVIRTGTATWDEGLLLFLQRNGFPEETYHTFSYSPVPDDAGGVGGMLCVVTEDTERTVGERRLKALRELAPAASAKSADEACRVAAAALAGNPNDLPFALLYLADADGRSARLAGRTGVEPGSPVAPDRVSLLDGDPWPFARAAASRQPARATGDFGPVRHAPWPEPVTTAYVLPLAQPGDERVSGFLVAGLSPRRPHDDAYLGFLSLVAGQVTGGVAAARAFEAETERAERLAELDRAKTAFFSNVSHEFRTPLTLMLGPLDDVLSPDNDVLPGNRERLEVVRRNGLRLQKLVNALLDFSRIEAGRVRAAYEPTDLPAYTAELASGFRSACERAGLRLAIDCPPLGEVVYVDREMWEKVVLNLVSNAFKFTFEGAIAVSVGRAGASATLTVRDTGTGITAEQLPHVFERFHRVEGARARTHEGTGIGLALVQELVKLHGGTVAVDSAPGVGTAFTVSVPLGTAHLPADRVVPARPAAPSGVRVEAFVDEAARWLPDGPVAVPAAGGPRPLVLLADDNADMRDYVRRLLAPHYDVTAVPDGEAALKAVAARRPDLVLTDVMMPRLDGFGLLKALRADPGTAAVPVVVLSARAGEEATVEGLDAGADDYLVKPFSARELLARVGGALALARVRREAGRREQELRAETAQVLEGMTDGFLTVSRDWRIRYVNAAAERVYRVSRDTLIGRELWEAFVGVDETAFGPAIRRAMRERVPTRAEDYYPPLAGWFDVDVYPVADGGLAVFFRDVTARRAAETAVRESQQFLDRITAVAPTMLYVYDLDGTRNVWVNRSVLAALGYDAAEVRRMGAALLPNLMHEADAGGYAAHNARLRRLGPDEVAEFEYRMRHRDGSWRWLVSREMAYARGADGAVSQVIGAALDVTDRKRAEEALKDADRRKDEFLATLAHELRNPLAPVRTGLHVLKMTRSPDDAARARDVMDRQVAHMVRLIDDLLDVSRVSRGKIDLKRVPVDARAVVEAALEVSRPLLDAAGHALAVAVPDGPLPLDADPTRLAQVVSNLLNNAAKYTPDGGRVGLSVERDGGEVVIRVTDTGVGIPADMLPKVFDLFTQVGRSIDRAQGGLGIGLSLVKKLVEMHGGSVTGESDGPGRGSTFTVRLPLSKDEGGRMKDESGLLDSSFILPPSSLPKVKVLVVDDNVDAAESLATVLRLTGHDASTAHDGPAAVDAVRRLAPDVVLLDIGLPGGMSGYDVADRVRREHGRRPVLVAVTGWGGDEDKRRAAAAGFDFHLTKPVEADRVAAILAGVP